MSTSEDPRDPTSSGPDDQSFGSPSVPVLPGSAEDLTGFSTFQRSAGNLPVLAVLLVSVLFSAAVLWWVFLR